MMNSDFSSPQRQSLVGVVIMFLDTFQKSARAFWPLLIVWIFRIKEMNLLYVGLSLLVLIVLVAVIAYLKYRNFTFYLDDANQEFVVKSGILNKSRLAIPLDKIQQVNINQSFIQKIIDVHTLEVDTAGSSAKEVAIKAITHELALSLKARLLESETKISESFVTAGETQQTTPFIKISLLSLFKTGITSNYIRSFGLLLVFIISTFHHINDFLEYSGTDADPFEEYYSGELILNFMYTIIIGVIIITLLINLTRTIVRFFGFTITKQNGSLLLSYGLINTKNTIIRPSRVQILTIGRNFFQKKLDIQDLKIRQASNADFNEQGHKKTALEIPGINTAEKEQLLTFILDKNPERGEMIRPNIRKLLLSTFKFIIIPVAIYFTFVYYIPDIIDSLAFMIIYIVFAGLMVYFSYRNSRLFVNPEFIIKQSGAWDIDNDITQPDKIQAVVVQQYFWQKSANVGSITLHTAGGSVYFGPATFSKLKKLANHWLYQVETSRKNWM